MHAFANMGIKIINQTHFTTCNIYNRSFSTRERDFPDT